MDIANVFHRFSSGARPSFDNDAVAAYCSEEQILVSEFFERFSRYVVEGYLSRQLDWLECDIAVNALSPRIHEQNDISDLSWDLYLAFDAGEYHPLTPHLSEDEVTRPLVEELATEHGIA